MCGVCYLKIPRPQPLWTVVLRALKEKDNISKKKIKKGYENIRQVSYTLKLGYDGLKLVYVFSKTVLDKFVSKGCDWQEFFFFQTPLRPTEILLSETLKDFLKFLF